MKKKAILFVGFVFVCSSFVFAQTKTITNADLEKFKQKRLAAEKDLRENYAKLGFPSPEELNRQKEKSKREFYEFSNRLRQQQLARKSSQGRDVVYYQVGNTQNRRNNSYTRSGFINYDRVYGGYYYQRRYRRYRNYGNRRYKRSRDFRQRFINGLPNYVLRNHRFTQINTRTNRRPIRRRNR